MDKRRKVPSSSSAISSSSSAPKPSQSGNSAAKQQTFLATFFPKPQPVQKLASSAPSSSSSKKPEDPAASDDDVTITDSIPLAPSADAPTRPISHSSRSEPHQPIINGKSPLRRSPRRSPSVLQETPEAVPAVPLPPQPPSSSSSEREKRKLNTIQFEKPKSPERATKLAHNLSKSSAVPSSSHPIPLASSAALAPPLPTLPSKKLKEPQLPTPSHDNYELDENFNYQDDDDDDEVISWQTPGRPTKQLPRTPSLATPRTPANSFSSSLSAFGSLSAKRSADKAALPSPLPFSPPTPSFAPPATVGRISPIVEPSMIKTPSFSSRSTSPIEQQYSGTMSLLRAGMSSASKTSSKLPKEKVSPDSDFLSPTFLSSLKNGGKLFQPKDQQQKEQNKEVQPLKIQYEEEEHSVKQAEQVKQEAQLLREKEEKRVAEAEKEAASLSAYLSTLRAPIHSETRFKRFVVLESIQTSVRIETKSAKTTNIVTKKQVVLRVIKDSNSDSSSISTEEFFVILRSSWMRTVPQCGDIFHLIEATPLQFKIGDGGELDQILCDAFPYLYFFDDIAFSAASSASSPFLTVYELDDHLRPLLVLHPDTLISGTRISEASTCLRKAVLAEKVANRGEIAPIAMYGQMVHSLFEAALKENDFSEAFLTQQAKQVVADRIVDIFCIKESDATALENVQKFVASIHTWGTRFRPSSSAASSSSSASSSSAAPNSAALVTFSDNEEFSPSVSSSSSEATALNRLNGQKAVCVSQVHDIEESFWSPMWGVKGFIDASVELKVDGAPSHLSFLAPFELKSGKSSGQSETPSHRAQVMLYQLMMEDRYERPARIGILHYLTNEASFAVRPKRAELKSLLQLRNQMAVYLRPCNSASPSVSAASSSSSSSVSYPDLLQNARTCKMCNLQRACMLTHWALENGTTESAGIGDTFNESVSHLTHAHRKYLQEWDHMLRLEYELADESGGATGARAKLWSESPSDSIKTGKCFLQMIAHRIEGKQPVPASSTPVSSQSHSSAAAVSATSDDEPSQGDHWYKFSPSPETHPINWSSIQLEEGDSVSISHVMDFGFRSGQVISVNPIEKNFILALEKPLHVPPREALRMRSTRQQMEVDLDDLSSIKWRIDKDEGFSTLATVRDNLMRLFYNDSDSERLRRLIIDLQPPLFSEKEGRRAPPPPPPPPSLLPGAAGAGAVGTLSPHVIRTSPFLLTPASPHVSSIPRSVSSPASSSTQMHSSTQYLPPEQLLHFESLNGEQQKAVMKVLAARDFALLLGAPGCGKTTTIAVLVQALVAKGKRVLLTSYTHTGVDNILLKLSHYQVPFVRLGKPHLVHPAVRPHILNADGSMTSVNQLRDHLLPPRGSKGGAPLVVATTCLSAAGNALLSRLRFDICIVDEASQITQPVCLGPIRLADAFVLVGDVFQLPPLVKSHEARALGMDCSLFRRLAESHPQAIVSLECQYRMAADIMLLCNALFYNYRLTCGTVGVAEAMLHVPLLDQWPLSISSEQYRPAKWILDVLDPKRRVLFLDTDLVPATETRTSVSVLNYTECNLLELIIEHLIVGGVSEHEIGVICPLRSQLRLLTMALANRNRVNVECHTVDKYQGRDKECILVSFVRSNGAGNVGNLLRDWRRVNVALSRAKSKLILVGSRTTLTGHPPFGDLMDLLHKKGWIYVLPAGAQMATFPPQ